MKIAVCVKQVPSTTAVIRVAADGSRLELAGVETVVGPYDEYALEEALKVREKNAGSTIVVVAVGGEDAGKALTHAYALGVDRAVLVQAPDADPAAAATCAAGFLKGEKPDLVFCGRQAIDDDQWLFPGALGEALDLPHVTAASAFELAGTSATCKRRIEGGEEVIEVKLPAVISCEKGLNEPRVPTLKGRLNAKKMKVETKSPADVGVDAAKLAGGLKIERYAPPPEKSPGKRIEGKAPAEAAAELVKLLREEAKVI